MTIEKGAKKKEKVKMIDFVTLNQKKEYRLSSEQSLLKAKILSRRRRTSFLFFNKIDSV